MKKEEKTEPHKLDTPPCERSEHYFVTRDLITHDADGKRRKTKGEKTFDWLTYGGFGWIANEFVSGEIADQTIEKGGKLNHFYDSIVNKLHKTFKIDLNNNSKSSWITTVTSIFVMTLGGHLMVGPIRYFEDRKNKIVRGLDVIIDGKQALDNPKTIAKHEAMDKEPQQSWGSLWQGRLVTVASAIGMHFAIGEKNAWSTKFLSDDSPLSKWSSLERINTSFFRMLGSFADNYLGFDKGAASAIQAASIHVDYHHDILSANSVKRGKGPQGFLPEGKVASFGKKYGLVFMVSGVLAAGFYISSKLFARDNERTVGGERQPMHHNPTNPVLPESYNEQLDSAPANTRTPKNRVESIQPYTRLEQQQAEIAPI